MTIMPEEPTEEMLRVLFTLNSATPRTTEEVQSVYQALLNFAALARPVQEPVAMKPLEWKGATQKALVAEPFPCFKYTIIDDERGVDWSASADELGWNPVDSVDDAKAVCQDDFNARLRNFINWGTADAK